MVTFARVVALFFSVAKMWIGNEFSYLLIGLSVVGTLIAVFQEIREG